MNKCISPSRTYVAMVLGRDGGYSFQKFDLPQTEEVNNTQEALWYYLSEKNKEDEILEGCVTFEDYSNYIDLDKKVKEKNNGMFDFDLRIAELSTEECVNLLERISIFVNALGGEMVGSFKEASEEGEVEDDEETIST